MFSCQTYQTPFLLVSAYLHIPCVLRELECLVLGVRNSAKNVLSRFQAIICMCLSAGLTSTFSNFLNCFEFPEYNSIPVLAESSVCSWALLLVRFRFFLIQSLYQRKQGKESWNDGFCVIIYDTTDKSWEFFVQTWSFHCNLLSGHGRKILLTYRRHVYQSKIYYSFYSRSERCKTTTFQNVRI